MIYEINKKYIDYTELAVNIKQYFNANDRIIHKARNEIKRINHVNTDVVVKSYKVPHFINKIVYTFLKDSKARRSFYNSLKIMQFVPTPIAYIEFRKHGLIADSYFINEYCQYDFTIREPLLNETFEDQEEIFKQFARFTFNLHNNNILHKDYSPGNILIKRAGNKHFIFTIVDINRLEFKNLTLEERLKNFCRLWALDKYIVVMVKEYAKLIRQDEKYCIKMAIHFSQKHKDRKNLKKKLKGIKVVD
jgi:serine/threonine protein kinase